MIEYAKSKGLRAAGRHFGIPKSTVNDWMGKSTSELSDSRQHKKGAGRKVSYGADVEKKILQWVLEKRESKQPVSYEEIKAYAVRVVREEKPDVTFNASSGWVYRFLKRNSLVIKHNLVLAAPIPKAKVRTLLSLYLVMGNQINSIATVLVYNNTLF